MRYKESMLFKICITIHLLIVNISLAFGAEEDTLQAVFKSTVEKVKAYRNFNLILLGLVVAMVIVAIVIRIYTDKEIMYRRIMDRRYDGKTLKEEAKEALEAKEEDIRDKDLAPAENGDKPVLRKDKDNIEVKQVDENVSTNINDISSMQSSQDDVEINYVPKVPKDKQVETKANKADKQISVDRSSKSNISEDLLDEIESIEKTAIEAKAESIDAAEKDAISKLKPCDVIIEGEQLNLKPSEIDIDYTPTINNELLRSDIRSGSKLDKDKSVEGAISQESTQEKTVGEDGYEHELWLIDIDEPQDEYEFIQQDNFVYEVGRPRFQSAVSDAKPPEKLKKPTKRDLRRERRNIGRNAIRQAELTAKQSQEFFKQKELEDKVEGQIKEGLNDTEHDIAELEKRYSQQDFG